MYKKLKTKRVNYFQFSLNDNNNNQFQVASVDEYFRIGSADFTSST